MTEEEKDILILKILERPQSLTDDEVSVILSDQELLDIYNTSRKVKDALKPTLKVDPAKEWSLMKARIEAHESEASSMANKEVTKEPSENVRKSLLVRFLGNISKKPVAAAVVMLIVAAAIAASLLWNPTPIQSSQDEERLAQNKTNATENIIGPVEENSSESSDTQYSQSLQNEGNVISEIENMSVSNPSTSKANIPSNSATKTPNVSTSTDNPRASQPVHSIQENVTIVNNPSNTELAYSEDGLEELDLRQLDGMMPEDWDIDQCIKLQQARVDNELALAMADSRKKEYELFKENFLLEYLVANPESDQATLQEVEAYLDEYFGTMYSAVP